MTSSTLTPLAVGQVAPDFTLRDQNGVEVSLAELTVDQERRHRLLPLRLLGHLHRELDEIRDHLERFVADDLQVVCSRATRCSALRAWADTQGYFFPLLSDYWPHGAVTRAVRRAQRADRRPGARHLPHRPRRARALDPGQRARGRRDFSG